MLQLLLLFYLAIFPRPLLSAPFSRSAAVKRGAAPPTASRRPGGRPLAPSPRTGPLSAQSVQPHAGLWGGGAAGLRGGLLPGTGLARPCPFPRTGSLSARPVQPRSATLLAWCRPAPLSARPAARHYGRLMAAALWPPAGAAAALCGPVAPWPPPYGRLVPPYGHRRPLAAPRATGKGSECGASEVDHYVIQLL